MIEKKKREKVRRTPLLILFGANVRKFRLARNLSQEKLAEIADLHPTYISSIEQGNRNLSLETANRIALALNLKLISLLEEYA